MEAELQTAQQTRDKALGELRELEGREGRQTHARQTASQPAREGGPMDGWMVGGL